MSPERELELRAHADAGVKLAMIAMEFLQNFAATQGKTLDFKASAYALINSEGVDNIDAQTFAIEKRSREIAADKLMILAKGFGQVKP